MKTAIDLGHNLALLVLAWSVALPAAAQPALSYPLPSGGTVLSRVTYPVDPAMPMYDDASPSAHWESATCEAPARVAHTGVDIAIAAGTTVFAVADASSVQAVDNCPDSGDSDCNHGYGNAVTLFHEGGWATRYAHLLRGSVPPLGGAVTCGQYIGLVGSSGNSSGPHLHFELRSEVTGTSLFRKPAWDPFGGACSLSTDAMWAMGTTMTCAPSGTPDHIAMVTSASATTIATGTDAPYVIRLVFRNVGSVTWSPGDVAVLRLTDDATGGTPARYPLGTPVGPGGEAVFEMTAIAPERAGEYTLQYGMSYMGLPFQAFATVRVSVGDGTCASATLGREVSAGECVQQDGTCRWFSCRGTGGWQPVNETQCPGVTYPNDDCSCGSRTLCGTCTGGSRCALCDGECVEADAATACMERIDDPVECPQPVVCPGASCMDDLSRIVCEGEMGLQRCGASGVRVCVCGESGLEQCGTECIPL